MARNGWANLLDAIDYRQKEPERQAANELRLLQLQTMREKLNKERDERDYLASLNNPVSPERTETVPDEAVNTTLANAQQGLNKYGIALDPSLQGQATTTKTIPATYLNDTQKLQKMAQYYAMNGDMDKYKKYMEGIKIQKEMSGVNNFVWSVWDAAKGDERVFRQIMADNGATPEQIDNIDTSAAPMGFMGSKTHGVLISRDNKFHNKPKPEDPNKNQTEEQLIAKSLEENLGRKPTATEILAETHKRKLAYATASRAVVGGGMPAPTKDEFESDKALIRSGALLLDDVIKGAGRGGQGQAYARKLRTAIRNEDPSFNFNLQKMLVRGDSTEISQAQGMRGKILSFEQAAVQNAKQLYQLSEKIDPVKLSELNRAILAGKTRIDGDPVASSYLLAWRTFVNEYARVSTTASGGGITTDTARKEMEEAIRNSSNKEQMQAMLRQAVMEMRHREYGYDVQLKQVYDRWGGRPNFDPKLPTEEDVYKIFSSETPYVVPDKKPKAAKPKTWEELKKQKGF